MPKPKENQLHPLTALVKNKSGVLSRLSGLFARRGFNIDSLAVGETTDPRYSRISIIVKGDRETLDQVVKQLNKQVDVISVKDLSDRSHVERELSLIKVHASTENRSEIIELADIFRAKVADVGKDFVIVEATGSADKVEALEDLLEEFGIEEIARTGRVVLERAEKRKDEKPE
ncbi:acetolactate synthase small subunit [Candidatus Bipolaricaulota bacterium]|nr:acetolactate synthase small subunit [Candidatus Bipolaricaulota bacterium]MBS3791381.1 acetolactate synthase small subunit [Candidatus Bipolaricaulota bacterium]